MPGEKVTSVSMAVAAATYRLGMPQSIPVAPTPPNQGALEPPPQDFYRPAPRIKMRFELEVDSAPVKPPAQAQDSPTSEAQKGASSPPPKEEGPASADKKEASPAKEQTDKKDEAKPDKEQKEKKDEATSKAKEEEHQPFRVKISPVIKFKGTYNFRASPKYDFEAEHWPSQKENNLEPVMEFGIKADIEGDHTGLTRVDFFGAEAKYNTDTDEFEWDWKGTVKHTFPDIPIGDQRFAVAGYAARNPSRGDIFIDRATTVYGGLVYWENPHLFFQIDRQEEPKGLPWKKVDRMKGGFMIPLAPPKDDASKSDIWPHSAKEIWDESKVLVYYETRNFHGLEVDLPNPFDKEADKIKTKIDGKRQAIGAAIDYRFKRDPEKKDEVANVLGDAKLIAGVEYRTFRVDPERFPYQSSKENYIAPFVYFHKPIPLGQAAKLDLKFFFEQDKVPDSMDGRKVKFDTVNVVGMEVALNLEPLKLIRTPLDR